MFGHPYQHCIIKIVNAHEMFFYATRSGSQPEWVDDNYVSANQPSLLEYPRYDKRPACPLSTVFRTCHAVYNVLTVFALDPLPRMYVFFFITTLRPTRPRTNVYINSPNLLLDLARLRGSLFNPSERRSPAHFNNHHCCALEESDAESVVGSNIFILFLKITCLTKSTALEYLWSLTKFPPTILLHNPISQSL